MTRAELILDRYRPLGEIGVGGFGTVQVAWDPRIQRKVAIKTIELTEFDAARAMLPGADAVSRIHGAKAGETASRWHGVLPWEDVAENPDAEAPHADGFAAPSCETDGAACPVAPASTPLSGVEGDFSERRASAGVAPATAADSDIDPSAVHALAHIPGLDEARTAAMLSDPRIVTVYDFEVRDRMAYLIMEYVEGITLTQLMRDYDEHLTLDMVGAVFDAVAGALIAAHESGVLHLDIKPDNILINKDGQVKVTDFGLATLADAAGLGTTGGGTIGYMPPEQMRRDVLDARADEWSLASVTYEMLTGNNPFYVPRLEDAEAAIVNAELVLPSLCWDDLDEQIDDVLFYALDPDREQRYASVSDFAEEAEKFLGDPARGRGQLKLIVADALGESTDDEITEEEAGDAAAPAAAAAARAPRIPMSQKVTKKTLAMVARAFAAVGCAFVALVACQNAPFADLFEVDPAVVGGIAVLALAVVGAITPSIGALVAFCLLSIMFIVTGSPIVGVVMLLLTIAWFMYAARSRKAEANAALALPLVGAIGGNVFVPLAIGAAARPSRAMVTTAYALAWAFVLGAATTTNLLGWNGISCFSLLGNGVAEQRIALMLGRPANWVMAAGWVGCAGVEAACNLKRSRSWAIVGACAGAAVLVVGSLGAAWVDSGMKSIAPSPQLIVPLIVSAAAVIAGVALLKPAPGADEGTGR